MPVGHVAAIGVAYRAGIQGLLHVGRPSTSSWQGEKVLVVMGIKDRFSDMAAPSSMTASPARQLYGRLNDASALSMPPMWQLSAAQTRRFVKVDHHDR